MTSIPWPSKMIRVDEKNPPSKFKWDFSGHLICNHSASGSANRIRHLGSIESNASLLSTGQAQEIMQSSRIKQNNDRVLVQKERTGKNLLTKRNLLQRSEDGRANPRRRWADRNIWLTDRWWRGPGSETLPRLETLMGEVSNLLHYCDGGGPRGWPEGGI
jgi:hypothetical protein